MWIPRMFNSKQNYRACDFLLMFGNSKKKSRHVNGTESQNEDFIFALHQIFPHLCERIVYEKKRRKNIWRQKKWGRAPIDFRLVSVFFFAYSCWFWILQTCKTYLNLNWHLEIWWIHTFLLAVRIKKLMEVENYDQSWSNFMCVKYQMVAIYKY